MKAVDAVAEILKREGVKYVFAYPNDPIIDAVARADPYSIIVRQELMCRMALVTLTGGSITSSGAIRITNDPTLTDEDFADLGTAPAAGAAGSASARA